MKKFLAVILATLMLCTLFAGCGKGSMSMATGGTSGTYYGFSGVVTQVLNEKLDKIDIAVESTGASKANIQLVQQGGAQFAIVQNDVMSYAYNAEDMFEGEDPITNFSAIACCYPEQCQIIANKDITSIEDLKGKKVSVGSAGSGVEFNARQILDAYGITFDDIDVNNQSFADSADSLKNGTIDAAFITAGAPTTAVTELSSTFDFNVLPIDDEHVATLKDKYGFYTPVTIPGGTYKCVEDDIQTVAVMATFIASNDVPEETVYEFTKGLFDYKDEIAASHTKGELLDPETAVSGVPIPFHPGAEKYFNEIGVK